MDQGEISTLRAWSNGQWLYLDLVRNRYLGGRRETSDALQFSRIAAAARLQDSVPSLDRVIPNIEMLTHFMRSAWQAWRVRGAPIGQQVRMLQSAPGGGCRSSRPQEVQRRAATFQHLRNLRLHRPLCLEDAVGCALFLRRYVVPLSFHIGVVQPPFKAHAWVQSGDLIVNDRKHAVEAYSEILRVDL